MDRISRAVSGSTLRLLLTGVRGLYLFSDTCKYLAVGRVYCPPHVVFKNTRAVPDFSSSCRERLVDVDKCGVLQLCSQHCGFGRELQTHYIIGSPCVLDDEQSAGIEPPGGGALCGKTYSEQTAAVVVVDEHTIGNRR